MKSACPACRAPVASDAIRCRECGVPLTDFASAQSQNADDANQHAPPIEDGSGSLLAHDLTSGSSPVLAIPSQDGERSPEVASSDRSPPLNAVPIDSSPPIESAATLGASSPSSSGRSEGHPPESPVLEPPKWDNQTSHDAGRVVAQDRDSSPSANESAGASQWRAQFDLALSLLDIEHGASNAVQQEKLRQGLQAINRAILEAPEAELGPCYSTRGYFHLLLGDYQRADDDCSAALERNRFDEESLVWRGCARAGLSLWSNAVDDLSAAIEIASERSAEFEQTRQQIVEDGLNDLRQRIRALMDSNRSATSESDTDSSSQVPSTTATLFNERGQIYLAIGEHTRALRDFRQATEADPTCQEAKLGIATCLYRDNDFENALQCVEELIGDQKAPAADAIMLRARIHQGSGQTKEALADLDRLGEDQYETIALRVKTGEIRLELGDFAGAIFDLSFAIRKNRKWLLPRRLRADTYLAAKNFELAIRDYDYLIERQSDDAELLVLRGDAHWSKDDLEHAGRDFQRALQLDELSARAYLGLSKVLLERSQLDKAMSYVERALRLDSRLAEALIVFGRIYFEQKKIDASIEQFTRALAIDAGPEKRADCLYRRGIAYCQRMRYEEAIEDFGEAIQIRQYHAGSFVWRSRAFAASERWGDAIQDLKQASHVNPAHSDKYHLLGREVSERAIAYFTDQIGRDEDLADAHYHRACARRFLGQHDAAIDDFRRAVELEPQMVAAVVDWSEILERDGEFDQAIELVSELIEQDNSSDRAFARRSTLLAANGDAAAATSDIRKAIRLKPKNGEYRLLYSQRLVEVGRFERACQELDRVTRLDPSSYQAFRLRGRCQLTMGNWLPAIHDFSRSMEVFPEQPETLAARGHAYLKNHQHVQALADFESALTKSAQVLDAYTGRAIVMAKRGESEAALVWLTKAIHRFEDVESWSVLLMARARIFFNVSRFGRAIADYSTVLNWSLPPATQAAAVYSRGVALLHEGDTSAARHDFEHAQRLEPKYKPPLAALQWLSGEIRQRPKALIAPKQAANPTRPRKVSEIVVHSVDDQQWDADPPHDQWIVKTGDGVEFGPAPKAVIDQWGREGRLDDSTRLLRSDWAKWKRAAVVFPELHPDYVEPDPEYDERTSATAEADSAADNKLEKPAPIIAGPDESRESKPDSGQSAEETRGKSATKSGSPKKSIEYGQFESIDEILGQPREDEFPGIEIGDE